MSNKPKVLVARAIFPDLLAKLEESFEELRSIREKYEEKVKEYEEKKRVWDTLKNQDL